MRNYLLLALALAASIGYAPPVDAAWISEVPGSFNKKDMFDIELTISYEYHSWRTLITRERIKGGTVTQKEGDGTPSTYEPGEVVAANRLEYRRKFHVIHLNAGIGIIRAVGFFLDFPIIMGDTSTLKVHPDVQNAAGCGDDPYGCISDVTRFLDLPYEQSQARYGLRDIGIGLVGAPFQYRRDLKYPSWVIGLVLRIPIDGADGDLVKKQGTHGVSEGLYVLELNTAISRRITKWFEPYFDLHGKLRFPSKKSLLYDESLSDWPEADPGHTIGLVLGTEFIPWEVKAKDQFLSIDLGAGLDYTFAGRGYSELFEALADSSCNGSATCDYTRYESEPQGLLDQEKYLKLQAADKIDQVEELDKADPDYEEDKEKLYQEAQDLEDQAALVKQEYDKTRAANGFERTDGITNIEGHGQFDFWLGLTVQPIKYLRVGLRFTLSYLPSYFIAMADAGKDAPDDIDSYVSGYNTSFSDNDIHENEYYPKYLVELDEVGNRFRASSTINWALVFNLAGRF
jgi:hypothetical protein